MKHEQTIATNHARCTRDVARYQHELTMCRNTEQHDRYELLIAKAQQELDDIAAVKANPDRRHPYLLKLDIEQVKQVAQNTRLFNVARKPDIDARADEMDARIAVMENELQGMLQETLSF